jgi:hypothetical protein
MTDDVAAVLDLLLPGDGQRWPAFSRAVNPATFLADSSEPVRRTLLRLAAMPAQDRHDALVHLAAKEPEALNEAMRAATDAYYTAAPVLSAVRALADTGPREPMPHVDATLVAGVLARAAARSR